MAAGDYLSYYAESFNIVEVDSTYYRIPAKRSVQRWFDRTPDEFQFAVKAPGSITHEKILVDCEDERDQFLQSLEPLAHKLHSILLQFGYFNKKTFSGPAEFFDRLDRFLGMLPDPERVAVEIRNKTWLTDDFFQLLRRHGTAYALTEHAWMPPVEEVIESYDCLTGRFAYLRLIGDRKGIEEITTTWGKVVIDRRERLERIAQALASGLSSADIVVFVNNHYAGHGPATCRDFLDAMARAGDEGAPSFSEKRVGD